MIGFVWIAFLVFQSSLCVQPEELVSSTGLNINEQSSTVSFLSETTKPSQQSNTPAATDTESNKETSIDTQDSLECDKDGDCTSPLNNSSAQPIVSPGNTAVSLKATLKDVDFQTTVPSHTLGKLESSAHPTTPDIYITLNHDENELDFEVIHKKQHVVPFNSTMKTSENTLDIANATFSSVVNNKENLFTQYIFTTVPSRTSEELTSLPTLEHLLKISSSEDMHLNVTHISDVKMSSQIDDINIFDTTAPLTTSTQLDDTRGKDPFFRYLNANSTISLGETTTDHLVLDAETILPIQETELLSTTILPVSAKLNSTDNFEKLNSEESSTKSVFFNSTNADKSNSSTTDQPSVTMAKNHVTIGKVETESAHSTTPAQSSKEIYTTGQSETLPPDIYQDADQMEISTLPSSNGLTDSLVNETKFTYLSTINPSLKPVTSESHTTVKIPNVTDASSTTASHHMAYNTEINYKDQEGTINNHLFQFNRDSLSKATTLPSEEMSFSQYPTTSPDDPEKVFPGTSSSLHTTVKQTTFASVKHSTFMEEQEATGSSILPMTTLMKNTMPQDTSSVDLISTRKPTSSSSEAQMSSMIDSTTITNAADQPTVSSSIDQISQSTPDQIFSTAKILFHNQEQASTTVDLSTSTVVDHPSPGTVSEMPSSSVDQTLSGTADQTTFSSTNDQSTPSTANQPTLPSTIDTTTLSSTIDMITLPSTIDMTTLSSTVDQKSSRSFQKSISSVDSTTADFISSSSVTSGEVKESSNTHLEDTSPSLILVSTTTSMAPKTSTVLHVFPSMLSTSTVYSVSDKESTAIEKFESTNLTELPQTKKLPFDSTTVETSNVATETHREGKHIPFSTESTRKETVESFSNDVILVTSTKEIEIETSININEVIYNQLFYEDLTLNDKSNVMSAIVQLSIQDEEEKEDINIKISKVHNWLVQVLMKEFQNWTRDPFDEIGNKSSDMPFGKVTIFYILPTPKTERSNITMTFVVHNEWRNETLPVDFVLSILNFYSADLKQFVNASSVNFYHGLLTRDSDIPVMLGQYGVVVLSIVLAVLGVILLACIMIVYKKRNRRSVHYLANTKLQRNLQESVGIDLTPAVVILQDEKKILNGNSKICDDEGWLVPIHEVPLAEDVNMPKVQDTKL